MRARLDELQRRLIEDDDPSEAVVDFLSRLPDELDNPWQNFEAGGHPLVEQVIRSTVEEVFGSARGLQVRLWRLGKRPFLHGLALLPGRIGTVVFFEDILIGAVAFVPGAGGSGCHFARFSAFVLPESRPEAKQGS